MTPCVRVEPTDRSHGSCPDFDDRAGECDARQKESATPKRRRRRAMQLCNCACLANRFIVPQAMPDSLPTLLCCQSARCCSNRARVFALALKLYPPRP
eukprot:1176636-Prorocentrum_minimum.AAC.4